MWFGAGVCVCVCVNTHAPVPRSGLVMSSLAIPSRLTGDLPGPAPQLQQSLTVWTLHRGTYSGYSGNQGQDQFPPSYVLYSMQTFQGRWVVTAGLE